MSRLAPASGGCNCGRLRYRISAEPLAVYICHCHLCQKKTGSAFGMYMILPASGFHLEEGEPERLQLPGSKSDTYVCRDCGSRVYSQRDGSPLFNLRAGTLDETAHIRPAAQLWTSSAQQWAVLKEDVLSYSEQPADFSVLLEAWNARADR